MVQPSRLWWGGGGGGGGGVHGCQFKLATNDTYIQDVATCKQ